MEKLIFNHGQLCSILHWGYGSRSNYMSQNVMQNIESGTGEISETIAMGKISIKANVNVVIELKK